MAPPPQGQDGSSQQASLGANVNGKGAANTEAEPADIAQAYRDLLRGEQAATALEANLSKLEGKLDELLAGIEGLEEPDADPTPVVASGPNAPSSKDGHPDPESKGHSKGPSKGSAGDETL